MIFELLHPSRRPQRGDVLKRGQENENNFKKVKVHSTKIRRTWRGNKLSIVDNKKKTLQQARWERRSLMRFWLSGRSWVSCAVILFFGRNRKLAIEANFVPGPVCSRGYLSSLRKDTRINELAAFGIGLSGNAKIMQIGTKRVLLKV